MSSPQHRHRPLRVIVQEVVGDKTSLSVATRTHLQRLLDIDQVTSEDAYAALCQARRQLGNWRSALARRVKAEMDTILSLYRVARWDEEARATNTTSPVPTDRMAAKGIGPTHP